MQPVVCLLTALLLLSACAGTQTPPHNAVTGEVLPQQLLAQYSAFEDEYRRYSVGRQELQAVQALEGTSVLVFMGTWCHDSVREVPRFLKLLDQSGVSLQQLQLIAVGLDKKDPAGLAQQYNLLYTPTIIVLDNDRELYRMVERPKGLLALDLQQGLLRAGEQSDESE